MHCWKPMELWCAGGHQKWSQDPLSIGTSGFFSKRCCGDHFVVKNSCQSGLILLQENHYACYDHRCGDSPAILLFYGMVSYPGFPLSSVFDCARAAKFFYCMPLDWTEEESNKGFLAGCSGKPSKARKLIWFHWTGGKFNKILHESHNKMGGGEGHDSRSISCWHLPGPFAPPSLSWWFALQPKVWDRFFGLERTRRVLCWLGAPKSIFSLCGKKKELFLLILNKRRKKNLPASLPS